MKNLVLISNAPEKDCGYEIKFIKDGTCVKNDFKFWPNYFRYPWGSYGSWLDKNYYLGSSTMAGSVFYCSRRVYEFEVAPGRTAAPYVDVFSVPRTPPYMEIIINGKKCRVSADRNKIYDVDVPCTYPSKKWCVDQLAAHCNKKGGISTTFANVLDGDYIVPSDTFSFEPIGVKLRDGEINYYHQFDTVCVSDEDDNRAFQVDLSSMIPLAVCRVNKKAGIVYDPSPLESVRRSAPDDMTRLPPNCWYREIDTRGGKILSVMKEISSPPVVSVAAVHVKFTEREDRVFGWHYNPITMSSVNVVVSHDPRIACRRLHACSYGRAVSEAIAKIELREKKRSNNGGDLLFVVPRVKIKIDDRSEALMTLTTGRILECLTSTF